MFELGRSTLDIFAYLMGWSGGVFIRDERVVTYPINCRIVPKLFNHSLLLNKIVGYYNLRGLSSTIDESNSLAVDELRRARLWISLIVRP